MKRGLRKKYLSLTVDQKRRGVIFSSQLKDTKGRTKDASIKEVFKNTPNKEQYIYNLKDDSFFLGSFWNLNEIRQ